jgi:hypothetical protein
MLRVRVRAQELDALATKHSNFKARPHPRPPPLL